MPTYTFVAVVAMSIAVVTDMLVLRTGLLAQRAYWISLAIMVFFQVFIDGWLTRARSTIVVYDRHGMSGVRVFFNTPVEDFGFGFALILLTLSIWTRLTRLNRLERMS